MSFTYDPGTSTPNLAGLVQTALTISSNPFRINDGTFELHSCGRLVSSAPLRTGLTTLPADHGASTGTPLYTEFPFDITGRLWVPTLSDIWAAYDLLLQAFNLNTGLQTLTLNASGWSATRQIDVLVDGQVQIVEPLEMEKLVPNRDFTVPVVAPDPRLYSTTQHSTTVTSSTAVTNAGTASTPITVRFTATSTLVNPQIDGPGTAGTNRIKYTGTIASGHWVEISANAAGTGVSAVDDTGANVYGNLSAFTARVLAPGASNWTATQTSGTSTTSVKFRDAWL